MSLCSYQVPSCGRGCFRPAMAFPRNEQDAQLRSPASSDNLHFGNIFEENGASGQHVNDMLTLERDVFQRCLSAQTAPTALQRFNRRKSVLLLQDLAATADLPPHSVLFSQQLLDLTHRCWSEAEDPDIDVNDVHSLAAATCICINCTPQGTLIRPRCSFQTLAARSLPDPAFSRLSLLFLSSICLTTFRCCVQPGRSMKSSLKNIVSWSQ